MFKLTNDKEADMQRLISEHESRSNRIREISDVYANVCSFLSVDSGPVRQNKRANVEARTITVAVIKEKVTYELLTEFFGVTHSTMILNQKNAPLDVLRKIDEFKKLIESQL